MFSICKNFIVVNGDLYHVKKIYEEIRIKDVDLVKDWLNVESVFRKDGKFYFCNLIPELEIIND